MLSVSVLVLNLVLILAFRDLFICPFILNLRDVLFISCGCALQPLNRNASELISTLQERFVPFLFSFIPGTIQTKCRGGVGGRGGGEAVKS